MAGGFTELPVFPNRDKRVLDKRQILRYNSTVLWHAVLVTGTVSSLDYPLFCESFWLWCWYGFGRPHGLL
jgi:hypothetical protein